MKLDGYSTSENKMNEHLNLLLQTGLISYFSINDDMQVIAANNAFCAALGYSPADILNQPVGQLLEPGSFAALQQLVALRNLKNNFIIEFISKAGHSKMATVSGNTDITTHTFLAQLIGTSDMRTFSNQLHVENLKLKDDLLQFKEVELKRQNAELVKLNNELKQHHSQLDQLQMRIVDNEMRSKLALNAVNDAVWDWDIATDAMYFSDRFFTMLLYDAFEFPHAMQTWLSLISSENVPAFEKQLDDLKNGLSENINIEYQVICSDGSLKWILCRGSVVEYTITGKPSRILGTHVDINRQKEIETELKQSETKLMQRNEEYHKINQHVIESHRHSGMLHKQLEEKQLYIDSILKTVPAVIGLVQGRKILFANSYACLTTGYDMEELTGSDTLLLYPSIDEYNRVHDILYVDNTSGNTRSVNTVWKMKNGTLIDVYISATHLESDSESELYAISALDVSSQRIYEDELLKAREIAEQAEKLKTLFLCNISHELRTPMNGVMGFSEVLYNNPNHLKRDEYLKLIFNSSKQLMRIISDIIDISKISSGDISVFHSSVPIKQMLTELHASFNQSLAAKNKTAIDFTLVYELPPENDHIIADETKLKKVLQYLLINAIKFTDKGTIALGCALKGERIEFYVSDTGIGIDSVEREIIFEAFRQTETQNKKLYGGTGIGLAIAKGFVEVMNGSIWVESEKSVGSTFYFSIPNIVDHDAELPAVSEASKWLNGFHILVVEDDFTCFTLIHEILDGTGASVSHAVTGLEAVRACRKDNTINLVLMDMRLPELDGYEATKLIKQSKPQLSIIAQTAHGMIEDRQKCLHAGCDDYLTKPIRETELFNLISKFIKPIETA